MYRSRVFLSNDLNHKKTITVHIIYLHATYHLNFLDFDAVASLTDLPPAFAPGAPILVSGIASLGVSFTSSNESLAPRGSA